MRENNGSVKKGTGIQSLELGVSILEFVSSRGRPQTFTEIHEGTGITKSNLYKYLNTLTALKLLYRDKFGGAYSLGPKLIEYGMSAVNQENVIERVSPYLQEISNFCGESVIFAVWTVQGPMVIKMINSPQPINIGTTIGSVLPLRSSIGVVFAAFLEEHIARGWIEKELGPPGSPGYEDYMKEVTEAREKGFYTRSGSLVPSVSAISAPILNIQSKILGVISVVGFTDTIAANGNHEIVSHLLEVSREVSRQFGYPG